jgi:nicotinamide riboside kinase
MKVVAIVGAPSVGKSSLVKKLQQRLKKKKFRVEVVEDPARIYIKKYIAKKRKMIIDDQYFILLDWLKEEDQAKKKNPDFILCDGASFLSWAYTFLFEPKDLLQREKPWSFYLTKTYRRYKRLERIIFKIVMKNLPSYDFVFFLPVEFPSKKDGIRLFTDQAYPISLKIRAFLETYLAKDQRWQVLKGSLNQRVNQALKTILSFS